MAEDAFLTPQFETLSPPEMESSLAAAPSALSRAFLHFHLHEAYSLQGKPHRADAHLAAVGRLCVVWESDDFGQLTGPARGRAAGVCALTRAQELSGNPLWEMGTLARIDRALQLSELHAGSNAERMYVSGRVRMTLPPGEGRDLRRALVTLSFLEKMVPNSSAVRFWLARTHAMHGNHEKADELRKPLPTVPRDSRSILESESGLGLKTPTQAALDGYRAGISPSLFFVTGAGIGGRLSVYDERLLDGARSARADFTVTSRGSLGVKAQATEAEWFPPVAVEVGGQWVRRYEDFYSLGIQSSDVSTTHLAKRFQASVALARPIIQPVYLKVGWRLEQDDVEVDPSTVFLVASAPSATSSRSHGPWGELGWDSRDSREDAFTGLFARAGGYFPSRELGSQLTFERWSLDVRNYFRPWARHGLVLGASLQHLKGDSAPLAEYPDLARALSLPGTRIGRFRERNAWGGFAEYRLALGAQYWLAGFGSVGTVAPQFDRLWKEPHKMGAGLALLLRSSPYRRLSGRLEGAVFGGELILNVGVGSSF